MRTMASGRTNQKLARPPSPICSPNSTRFRQPHQEDTSNLVVGGGAQRPPTTSKPTTPLFSSSGPHRPRSRLSRQGDYNPAEYSNDNDLWEQSQEYLNNPYNGGKRTPQNGRHYPASTVCSENKISQFPGPGSYNATLKTGGPSFSIGSRSSLRKVAVEKRSYSPGPGTYDVSTKNSGPSFSIAPKVREPVSQKDLNPGPGTYSDLSTSFGRGLSFSIRERFK